MKTWWARLGPRVRRQESEIRPEGRKTETQSQVKGGNDRGINDAYRQAYPVDAALTDLDNWDALEAAHGGFIDMVLLWCRKPE